LGLDKKGRLQESYQGNFDLYTCSFHWAIFCYYTKALQCDKIIGHMLSMDHFVKDPFKVNAAILPGGAKLLGRGQNVR